MHAPFRNVMQGSCAFMYKRLLPSIRHLWISLIVLFVVVKLSSEWISPAAFLVTLPPHKWDLDQEGFEMWYRRIKYPNFTFRLKDLKCD